MSAQSAIGEINKIYYIAIDFDLNLNEIISNIKYTCEMCTRVQYIIHQKAAFSSI